MPERYRDSSNRQWIDISEERKLVERLAEAPDSTFGALARLVVVLLDRVGALEGRNDREDDCRRDRDERG